MDLFSLNYRNMKRDEKTCRRRRTRRPRRLKVKKETLIPMMRKWIWSFRTSKDSWNVKNNKRRKRAKEGHSLLKYASIVKKKESGKESESKEVQESSKGRKWILHFQGRRRHGLHIWRILLWSRTNNLHCSRKKNFAGDFNIISNKNMLV